MKPTTALLPSAIDLLGLCAAPLSHLGQEPSQFNRLLPSISCPSVGIFANITRNCFPAHSLGKGECKIFRDFEGNTSTQLLTRRAKLWQTCFLAQGRRAAHNSAVQDMSSSADVDGSVQTSQVTTTEAAKSLRRTLYPAIEPYRTGKLKVSEIHTLYWEESGNPDGQPVVFLHGGPGGGTSPSNRRFFDPHFYRIILFDQRGSGKSEPHACLEDNTTWHLVDDIELVRAELNISKWLVFGGSWGSTLALTYAITHPERVEGLILRGIFLLRKSEIEWFYQTGADRIFPDEFEKYREFIPEEERADLVLAYHKRLMDESNPDRQVAAAKRWTEWEMATSYLVPSEESLKRGESDHFALAFARIENHFFFNKGFFSSNNFILENISKIRAIPGSIVQGRYDVVCPIVSAWDLHKAWPEAEFKVVATSGHSANEVGISEELVAAMEKFKVAKSKAES